MTEKKKVYLCGAINGKSDSECQDWRNKAKVLLGVEYATIDPMRRDYRGIEGNHTKDIVLEDVKDIADADVLLIRAEVPSWGTAMEIVYGFILGKTMIAWGVKDKASPWLMYHTKGNVIATLEEAISWIKTVV